MGVSHDGPHGDLLRRLVDQLPGMVAYWDPDLRLVLANAAYCRFVGSPAERLRGQHFSAVLGEEVYRANLPHLQAALCGKPQVFERTLPDGLGMIRHAEVSYTPDIVDGQIAGIFALITDVTPRVEAQKDLDEAQELAGLASWTFRPAEETLTWSRQLFRLAGRDPDLDVADWETYARLVHPEDRTTVESMRENAEHGRSYDGRHRLLIKDEVRHVRSRGQSVLDAHGDLTMMRGTVQDETELTRQTHALETANRRLADLIAMVGHDVRQPLGVVVAYLDEVIDQWDSDDHDGNRAHLVKALAAALRMNQMLENILAMINPDSNAVVVRPQRASLAEHVAQALAQEHYPVVPHLEIVEDADVAVDPFHLRQILANLLSNAVHHGAPPVTLTIEATEHEATLAVTDAGPGVPEEFVPRLFDRFTQASADTERAPTGTATGTGFGLYLVRELLHANSGTIEYGPASPAGAQFRITLPRVTT